MVGADHPDMAERVEAGAPSGVDPEACMVASQTSAEHIARELRNQILSGELAPETRLTHRELAVSFMLLRNSPLARR